MQIAILDFEGKRVIVRNVPNKKKDWEPEDIANSFESQLNIHLNDCQYMIGDFMLDTKDLILSCVKCGNSMTDVGDAYVCDNESCGYNQNKQCIYPNEDSNYCDTHGTDKTH